MAENYCEKDCAQCGYREELACPGCKAGPGRTFGGDCKLAQCCREKGHDSCATCNRKAQCGRIREAEQLPKYRLEKQKREKTMRAWLDNQIPLLTKAFTALFWLMIAANVPSFMSSDFTANWPVLYRTGRILELLVSLSVVAVYFLLGKVKSRYRKAALFMGLAILADFAVTWNFGDSVQTGVQLLKIPGIVLGILGRFQLYSAHSELLVVLDYELSEKWMHLWKWYIYCSVAMICGILLILPVLILLVVSLSAIGILVLDILELIYLYRMGSRFRDYARELRQ